ncbi:MAG: guanylate kinase [Chloroflexi bacterium]|nr:guanylate kinase [Chloroflexota bacterium]
MASRSGASGLVFILSGPSGVGKDSVTRLLKEEDFPLSFCVTATTRPPRRGEVHRQHYYFLSEAEFERLKAQGELLEYAVVHGNQYGTPASEVREGLRKGSDLLITVDTQGARTLRAKLPQAILIFLAPPSLEELVERLQRRGTDSPEQVELRLEAARREMAELPNYDYQIVNHRDCLKESAGVLKAIITAERHRVHPRLATL